MVSFNNLRDAGACLSTDAKPVYGIADGTMMMEMDTSISYIFDAGSGSWVQLESAVLILPAFFDDIRKKFLLSAAMEGNREPADADLSINGVAEITDVTDSMGVNGDSVSSDVIRLNGKKYNVSDDE